MTTGRERIEPNKKDEGKKGACGSRADQDQFAVQSQQRWSTAYQCSLFAEETVPVEIPSPSLQEFYKLVKLLQITTRLCTPSSPHRRVCDLFELNEAFAAQPLACQRELGIENAKLNVNGGAIAIGHPLGCSGARLATTLIHQMARTGASRGIASLCVGAGQGLATVFERE
jgi:acetyl-CoA acetyltransferase